jgi:hypothetical protein
MENKAVRYFIYGQVSFLLSVSICIFLLPESLFINDGISYFGAHKLTVVPYSIGLLLMAWFSYKVAQSLPKKSYKIVKIGFKTFSFLLVTVVAVPYGINFTLEYTHTLLSAGLFLVQFILMWWLAFKVKWDGLSLFLLLLMAAEMIATVMYLGPQKGYLLFGELAYQLTFAYAAYRAVRHIAEQTAAHSKQRASLL